MKTAEEIKSITEQTIANSGLFLVDVKVSKNNAIEITIDAQDGVNIDTCSQVSRKVETLLDRENEDFELTVSSAGIGCPFKVDGQYRKNIGKKVEVKSSDSSCIEGILKSYDGEKIVVEYEEKKIVEGKKTKETVKTDKTFFLSDIRQIKDIVSF